MSIIRENAAVWHIVRIIKRMLDYCRKWQEDHDISTEFIFCDEKGDWIEKTSYELFLRRHCRKLGFTVTNNHALRMSFNSNVLIPSGFDVRERALILGHSIEVNEKYYSHAGSFLYAQILDRVSRLKDPAGTAVGVA